MTGHENYRRGGTDLAAVAYRRAHRNARIALLESLAYERDPADHSCFAGNDRAAGTPIGNNRCDASDVMCCAIFLERIANDRRGHQPRKWEAKPSYRRESTLGEGRDAPRPFHSPGSSVVSGFGESGLFPPIAIIRSIASRALDAISGSTVMWCSNLSRERNTFGSVVTFMKAQTASSLAG